MNDSHALVPTNKNNDILNIVKYNPITNSVTDVIDDVAEEIFFDEEKLELHTEDYYSLSLRRKEFTDIKEQKRFVKNVEAIVRKSTEYREWVDYVKQVLGYFSCEVTGELGSQVTVEIHHHPISLFDITNAVVYKYILEEKEFCTFDIAQEVIQLHFCGHIGFVPLVKTMHEKVHNGYLSLPMEIIHGKWTYMLENYPFDDEALESIHLKTAINRENCGWGNGGGEGKYFWSRNNYSGK